MDMGSIYVMEQSNWANDDGGGLTKIFQRPDWRNLCEYLSNNLEALAEIKAILIEDEDITEDIIVTD